MQPSRIAPLLALIVGSSTASPMFAQTGQPEAFVVRHERLAIAIDYQARSLAGSMTLELENWTKQPASRVSLLLNRLMEVTGVRDASDVPLRFTQDVVRFQDDPMRQVTQAVVDLGRAIEPAARATVRVDYAGNLVGYTEVGWLYVKDHIDTAFSIIRADALAFPSIGGVNDAANRRRPRSEFTYEASVRVPSRYLVATGGSVSHTINADGTATWNYRSQGAAPFLNIAIAPFDMLVDGDVRVFYFPA